MTDPPRAELATAYAELGWPPVAARSSATAEDLAEASFAGQHDSYLDRLGDHPQQRRSCAGARRPGGGRADPAGDPDRRSFRRPAGHRVGPRGGRGVLRCAGAADHRPAAARSRPAHRLERAGPDRDVRPRQHRRTAARPADAAVRRPGPQQRDPIAAGLVHRADRPGRGSRGRRRPTDGQRVRVLPLQPVRHGPDRAAQRRRLPAAPARRADGCGGPLAERRPPALPGGGRPLDRPGP